MMLLSTSKPKDLKAWLMDIILVLLNCNDLLSLQNKEGWSGFIPSFEKCLKVKIVKVLNTWSKVSFLCEFLIKHKQIIHSIYLIQHSKILGYYSQSPFSCIQSLYCGVQACYLSLSQVGLAARRGYTAPGESVSVKTDVGRAPKVLKNIVEGSKVQNLL